MSKTRFPASSERGRVHGSIAPLAVVIATNLASAHNTDQYLAGSPPSLSLSPTTPSSTGGRRLTGRG